jgi:hypothetical protein
MGQSGGGVKDCHCVLSIIMMMSITDTPYLKSSDVCNSKLTQTVKLYIVEINFTLRTSAEGDSTIFCN